MKKTLTHLELVTKANAIIHGEASQALFHDVNVSADELYGFSNYLNENLPAGKLIKVSFKNTRLFDEHIDAVKILFPHLSALHFTKTALSDYSMNILIDYIENPFNELSTIHLEKNIIQPETYCRLLNVCKYNHRITKLFLNDTHDYERYNYSTMYEALADLLIHNSHISILTMLEKSCPVKFFEALPEAIAQNKGLTHLSLGYCAYTKKTDLTQRFVNAYKQQKMITQLEQNEISPVKGAKTSLNRAIEALNEVVHYNRNVFSPLFNAIENGNLDVTRKILSSDIPFSNHRETSSGYNLLHIAVIAKKNNIELIKLLFDLGYHNLVTTRAKSDHFSYTPLHLALNNKRYDIAIAMLHECQPYMLVSALDCAWSSGITARQMIHSLSQSLDDVDPDHIVSIVDLVNLCDAYPRGRQFLSRHTFFGARHSIAIQVEQLVDEPIDAPAIADMANAQEDRNFRAALSDDDSTAHTESEFDFEIDTDSDSDSNTVDDHQAERVDFEPTFAIKQF